MTDFAATAFGLRARRRLGTSLCGRYRLRRLIGIGGMAAVYLGVHRNGHVVAVKVLHERLAADPEIERLFRREAQLANLIDHPGVVPVIDDDVAEDGCVFLVMPLLEGETLRARVERQEGRKLPPEEVVVVAHAVLGALAAAHARKIVHRDIKPENIFLTTSGEVRVLDFGIGRFFQTSDTTTATRSGRTLGTPAFMAPEQALGRSRSVDGRTDLWALGASMFSLLSGRYVHEGESGAEVAVLAATRMAQSVAAVAPELPPALVGVVDRALAFDRGMRWLDAEAMDVALLGAAQVAFGKSVHELPRVAAIASTQRDEEKALASDESTGERNRVGQSAVDEWPGTTEELIAGPSTAEPSERVRGVHSEVQYDSFRSAPTTTMPREASARRGKASSRRWRVTFFIGIAGVLGLLGGTFAWQRVRARPVDTSSGTRTTLADTSSPIACPIFEVVGIPDLETWVGAAASSLACGRAKWYLGGRDDRILPPAALLGAPVKPTPDLPNYYDLPRQREHTLDIVRARGFTYLDGKVVRDGDSWRLDLFVRAPDGREIARASGSESRQLARAIKVGVSKLWEQHGLPRVTIDPEVARWTALPDIEAGLTEVDLVEQNLDHEQACATVERRVTVLGRAYYPLSANCVGPTADGGSAALDESSPAALVSSVNAALYASPSLPPEEEERLALRLDEMRAREPSRLGRAYIADTSATLWANVGDTDRARASSFATLADDPLFFSAWLGLASSNSTMGSTPAARVLASSWFPFSTHFLNRATSEVSDQLEVRIRDARLAYLLLPDVRRIISLGSALAEAGREDEARALAMVTPLDYASPDRSVSSTLMAFVDLHDARFAHALDRLESSGFWGQSQVALLAPVLGRESAASARWATAMLAMDVEQATRSIRVDPSTIVLCMNAGPGLSTRCLDFVEERAGAAGTNGWGMNGEAFLRGAKRYAVGDIRAAVDAWRPVVGGPEEWLARLLPTEAFERVGEDGLAARLDARKLKYRYFAGISDATPREARRAFKQGDRARARELAKSVVGSWEVADAVVPAVAEMRALLATLPHD